jgi:uncharacterized protein
MERHNNHKQLFLLVLILLLLSACDKQPESEDNKIFTQVTGDISTPVQEKNTDYVKPIIENKSYLFDVSDHSIEELQALLTRAEEVSETHPADFEDLEIVMIIHGPDIEWFRQKNHEHNQQLIDLAARLDAYEIIDMKVCEKTMSSRGVSRDDIPSFIEPVPFAPTEIERRLQEGYINL